MSPTREHHLDHRTNNPPRMLEDDSMYHGSDSKPKRPNTHSFHSESRDHSHSFVELLDANEYGEPCFRYAYGLSSKRLRAIQVAAELTTPPTKTFGELSNDEGACKYLPRAAVPFISRRLVLELMRSSSEITKGESVQTRRLQGPFPFGENVSPSTPYAVEGVKKRKLHENRSSREILLQRSILYCPRFDGAPDSKRFGRYLHSNTSEREKVTSGLQTGNTSLAKTETRFEDPVSTSIMNDDSFANKFKSYLKKVKYYSSADEEVPNDGETAPVTEHDSAASPGNLVFSAGQPNMSPQPLRNNSAVGTSIILPLPPHVPTAGSSGRTLTNMLPPRPRVSINPPAEQRAPTHTPLVSDVPGPVEFYQEPGRPGPSNAGPLRGASRGSDMSVVSAGRGDSSNNAGNSAESMDTASGSLSSAIRSAINKRKRKPNPVYQYVLNIEGTEYYQCIGCKEVLGTKNSTRFRVHCVRRCDKISSPEKEKLARTSRSMAVRRGPRQRSRVGLALERTDADNTEDPTCSNPSLSASVSSGHLGIEKVGARGCLSRVTIGSLLTRKRKAHGTAGEARLSPEQVQNILTSIMELIVLKGRPFNMFDPINGQNSPDTQLIEDLNPAFLEHLPNSRTISGRLLDDFYHNVRANVVNSVKSALAGGFGTIIFDGWDDVNSCPIVNVLLRTEGMVEIGRRVFFLKSVYTGSKRTGSQEYVRIIESVMEEYGGFDRICAVTSDNTSSCVNTRQKLTEKYPGIVGVNDQSHVADLLIEDMGRLKWIGEVISGVSYIAKELHNHKKLKEKFRTFISEYNAVVQSFYNEISDDGAAETEDGIANHLSGPYGARNPAILSRPREERIRTAVMLRQSSNTRFASAEGVLDSFIRSLEALRKLVDDDEFDSLFRARNAQHKKKSDEQFVNTIKDIAFESAVKDVHGLLCLLRRYLRLFDSHDSLISEVFPHTLELEDALQLLPVTSFITEERKNEVLSVFRLRRDGPTRENDRAIKVRLLEPVHYTAFMLDPNLAPDNTMDYIDHFRQHARKYASSRTGGDIDSMVQDLVTAYINVHEMWRIDREGAQRRMDLKRYIGNALLCWYAGNCSDGLLKDFATRTLSCSPTSCSVERSFSAQKKIQPKERNRLSREKVQKIIFCHWNIKLMKKMDQFDQNGF